MGGMTKTENQTGRQVELDLLKALAIVSMILCHCVIRMGLHQPGNEQDVCCWIGNYFFGIYMAAAHAFMFAMGVGIVYSRKSSPADLICRGIRLYVLGVVLNFFRYGIYALAYAYPHGSHVKRRVRCCDHLQMNAASRTDTTA